MSHRSPNWPACLAGGLLLALSLAGIYGTRRESLVRVHEYLLRQRQYSAAENVARLVSVLHRDLYLDESLQWKSDFVRRYHNWEQQRLHSGVEVRLD